LWQLLQDDPDVAAACACLLQEYEVEAERLEKDINALLQQLAEARLVTLG
jgi:erythromycin esterase-like protein